ncbi:hypothetical protein HKD37_05G013016 [Glycine soja]
MEIPFISIPLPRLIHKTKTTKEIWDSLSINYKRTKDVQLRKAATLMRHYWMFAPLELIHKRCTLSCSQYYNPSRCMLYLYHKGCTLQCAVSPLNLCKGKQKISQAVSPLKSFVQREGKNQKNSQMNSFSKALKVQMANCSNNNAKESTNDEVALMSRKFKQDVSDNEKSKSSDDKQANIYLMAYTDKKVKVKTCSKSDTSSSASSDDEEDMPYDLKKSNEVLGKKIQTLEESLSQASKTNESFTIENLREEVACITKDFGKFLESLNTLTIF